MIALGIIKMLCDISSHLKNGGDTEDKNVCHSFKLNLRLFIAFKTSKSNAKCRPLYDKNALEK